MRWMLGGLALVAACSSELSIGDGDGGPANGGSRADVGDTGGAGGTLDTGGARNTAGNGGAPDASDSSSGGTGNDGLPDAGPDGPAEFPQALAGIWLFGWSADTNHYSWIRFSPLSTTATDPATPGDGTIDILAGADAMLINEPFWPCSGQGRWFITQMPNTFSIELPPGCAVSGTSLFTINALQDGIVALRGCGLGMTMFEQALGRSLEACRYPDTQCDAAMTKCTPVN